MNHKLPHDIEGIFVELNLRKSKRLLFGPYNPPMQSDVYFFNHVMLSIANFMINTCLLEILTQRSQNCVFCYFFLNECKNNVKEPTCFKSLNNPS